MQRNVEQKVEEKVGVALLDVDGCFYYGIYDKPDDVPFEKWIIEKNKDILDALIKKYSDGYSKVVLGYITNRQSYLTDKRNGGTCTPLLPILQDYLQSKLKCEVVMDPFWSADIYANKKNGGDKQAGDSYKLALKNHFSDPELKDKHPEEVFDKTKGTLLYALTHRAKHFHPNATVDFTVIDDNSTILNHLNNFARAAAKNRLLPQCTIDLMQYDGETRKLFTETIQCNGLVDSKYDWSVRYVWSKNCLGGEDHDSLIQKAKDLEHAHHENHYAEHMAYIDTQSSELCLRFGDLPRFIMHESSKLTNTLGEKSNYTTAEALCKAGLIPKSFLVGHAKEDLDKLVISVEKTQPLEVTAPESPKKASEEKQGIQLPVPEYQLKPGEKRIVLSSSVWLVDLKELKEPAIMKKLIDSIGFTSYSSIEEFKDETRVLTDSKYPIWGIEVIVLEETFKDPEEWTWSYIAYIRQTLKSENVFQVCLIKKPIMVKEEQEERLFTYRNGIPNPAFVSPAEALKKTAPSGLLQHSFMKGIGENQAAVTIKHIKPLCFEL